MNQPVNLSRRNLLRGRADLAGRPIRPPGAIPETKFTDQCTTCGECISACPEAILVKGSGEFPEVDFRRGECTFCSKCINACAEDVLLASIRPPFRLQIEVKDSCLARRQIVCQTCGDACEADAIRFRPELGKVATPQVEQDLCTGCGACIAVCPEASMLATVNG